VTGQIKLVSAEALAGLFSLFADRLDCVLLNACYSEVQAKEISRHINSVIGMSQAIGDKAAISFAVGFYDALGADKGVEFAYKLGCSAISMQGIPEHLTPKLLTKSNTTKPEKTMTSQRVFISYRSQEPDVSLAQEFHDRLQAAGHTAFMAAKSISWGENWIERIDQELKQCDYFLLLLSEQSASSDMVAGEVRTARGLRDKVGKPIILPIRVNLPIDDPLNYELRSVLQTIQQKSWRSPDDTPVLVQEILSLMAAGAAPEPVTVEIPVVATIDAKNRPPLPVADLELPGGTIPLESEFYVKREPWDERCCQEIERKAGLIRIKAPRQTGKTSLLVRIRNHATQQGYRAISLDFSETDEATFTSSSIFLKRFCALVSRQLGISPRKVTEFWDEELFGPKENCSDYIEQYVLVDLTGPLFLGIDELDRLFPYEKVAKEFLMLLRAWNEKAKVNEIWSKLRMVIAHSTEAYVVMDTNSSPFNVGLAVDLAEFTSSQMLDLAARHGLNWETGEVEQLMAMVGGHPYLVRLSLYRIAQGDLTLAELLAEAPTDAGLFGEHLRRHLWNLQQHPELAQAFHQVIFSDRPVILEPMLAFKLNGMGLVELKGNEVSPRHDRLYRPYFRSRLSLRP
jgi:serine/threonine-protein kinase